MQILIQQVWHDALDSTFLTSSQVKVLVYHCKSKDYYDISIFKIHQIQGDTSFQVQLAVLSDA